ncbi:MAG: hypothetical protein R3A79_16665 [Nannocystaceae bacterium]
MVRRVGAAIVGAAKVSGAGLPITGGEDFAYFAQNTPSAYFPRRQAPRRGHAGFLLPP